jgi:hypothetical protein
MNDIVVLRPQRIASMRESMEELGRAGGLMREALTESNDIAHQTFFAPVLERLDLIVANESEGLTQFIADDLDGLRSAIRRIRLSDIDPALEMPTRALKALRGERGNLIESIDTALEAAAALGLGASNAAGGQLIIASRDVTEHLIRLDERLRTLQQTVGDLQDAAIMADQQTDMAFNVGLVNFHVKTMKVELSAARFETKIASDNTIATGTDLHVLSRSIEIVRDIATDLRNSTVVMRRWIAELVAAAGRMVFNAAKRAYWGLRTVVSGVLKRTAVTRPSSPQSIDRSGIGRKKSADGADFIATPPADFDMAEVHAMILRGETPPTAWRPFIIHLVFDNEPEFGDLSPLSGLSALTTLSVSASRVGDLLPLAGLNALTELSINFTQVRDLTPLAGLSALKTLSLLHSSQVVDISALSGLSELTGLYIGHTQVSDLSPLSRLNALRDLNIQNTQVTDLSPLSGLSGLTGLYLFETEVSDLRPISSLHALEILAIMNTQVSDLAPLSGLQSLRVLTLSDNMPVNVSVLDHLEHLTINGGPAPRQGKPRPE